MATRASAEASCRMAARAYPDKTYSVYMVGSEWMFTSEGPEHTQRKYKRPLRQWHVVVQGDPLALATGAG